MTLLKPAHEPPSREARPLQDVRGYAAAKGTLLACSGEIALLMQAFGPVSQVDIDWKDAPSYPSPYIAELKEVTVIPGCRVLLNAKGEALSDEIDLGFRLFGLRPKLWDIEITEGPYLHFKPAPVAPKCDSGWHSHDRRA
ncbi:MAG: hypothetical protein MZV65_53425 [Chromatiales bacterium]|nr:hypothetical protein [Chromatiales bacterium]